MQPTNLQSEYVKDETTTTTMILNEGESELGKNPSPRCLFSKYLFIWIFIITRRQHLPLPLSLSHQGDIH